MRKLEAEAHAEQILGHTNFVMYTVRAGKLKVIPRRFYITNGKRGRKDRIEAIGASWESALANLKQIVEKRSEER